MNLHCQMLVLIFSLLLSMSCTTSSNDLTEFQYDSTKRKLATIKDPAEKRDCPSAKEFVTAFKYLDNMKVFKLDTKARSSLAMQVAGGCHDAAARFVQTTELLLRAQLDAQNAIKYGLIFANKTAAQHEAFMDIFKTAYDRNILDLDLSSSLSVALQAIEEFPATAAIARRDFVETASYCVSNSGLDLPRSLCAQLAKRMVSYAQGYEQTVYDDFIQGFEFLNKDEDGPRMDKRQAWLKAEELVKISPFAVKNFVLSFRFAQDKAGLGLGKDEAARLAKELSLKTVQ